MPVRKNKGGYQYGTKGKTYRVKELRRRPPSKVELFKRVRELEIRKSHEHVAKTSTS